MKRGTGFIGFVALLFISILLTLLVKALIAGILIGTFGPPTEGGFTLLDIILFFLVFYFVYRWLWRGRTLR